MRSLLLLAVLAGAFSLPAADEVPPGLPILGPLVELTPRNGDNPQLCHLRSFKNGILEVLKDGQTHTVKADEIASMRFIPPEHRPLDRGPEREPGPNRPDMDRPDRPDRPGESRRPPPFKEIRRYIELYRGKLEGKLNENERKEMNDLRGMENGRPVIPVKLRMGVEADEEARVEKAQNKLDEYIDKWSKIFGKASTEESIRSAAIKLIGAYRAQGVFGQTLMEKATDEFKRLKPEMRDQIDDRLKELHEVLFAPTEGGMRRHRPDYPERDREPMPPPPNGKESRERPKP